jgi:hypothetical protein
MAASALRQAARASQIPPTKRPSPGACETLPDVRLLPGNSENSGAKPILSLLRKGPMAPLPPLGTFPMNSTKQFAHVASLSGLKAL